MMASGYDAPEVDRAMDAPELHRARYDEQAPEAFDQGDMLCNQYVGPDKISNSLQTELISNSFTVCANKARRLHRVPDSGAAFDLAWPFGLALSLS